MKKYEAVFILDIRKVDDDGDAFSKELIARVEAFGGKIEHAIPLGRRQFTYDIKKRKAGIYWNYILQLDPSKVLELKDKYRLDERVLRNMFVVYERPEGVDAMPVRAQLEN